MYIKGFDKNLSCRGYQFEVGKEYKIETDGPPELCTDTVFHFCESLKGVNSFYPVRDGSRYCEVEPLGEFVSDGHKFGCSRIRIVREIAGEELESMMGKTGGNTGLFNSGYRNGGDLNSGDMNAGNVNAGNMNAGGANTGNCNAGYYNAGNYNIGNCNVGDGNAGHNNAGCSNAGDWNSGSGNEGDWNSGRGNIGNRNAGDFNFGDCNAGCFNTDEPFLRMFNKPSRWTRSDYELSKACAVLYSMPRAERKALRWVEAKNMTDEEEAGHPEAAATGGYLKLIEGELSQQAWWENLSKTDKDAVLSLPNFDAAIFEMCTGVDVTKGQE